MTQQLTSSASFPAGGGEMGERLRTFDWSHHPLGPPDGWPQSLKTIVHVMLDSRYAMWLGWGTDLAFFYNDAYAAMTLGPRHPWALGRPTKEVWTEIWAEVGPRAESVLRTGQATWDEGLLLILERSGFPEETYHTFSYSPVPDDHEGIGGLLCVVTEDTERTIGERRLRTLRELATHSTDSAQSAGEACRTAAGVLATNPADVPFCLLYLLDAEGRTATLAGASGIQSATRASPVSISLDERDAAWPLAQVFEENRVVHDDDVERRFGALRGAAWPDPVQQALVLPMAKPGQARAAGFVVAGASPRRPLDDSYRGFFELVAGQVATAVASARAYEEERRRAEALSELDRAKTAFFSNVSHEFRTPLTLMLGPVEDLLAKPDGNGDRDAQRSLRLIHRNGLRMLKLVNTLLDFSRIEAGRAEARFEPVDLAAFTRELASVFRSAVEKAKLQLIVDCPPLDAPVFVDRDMWEKIVLNLLSNAFKFTFEGSIEVKLRSTEETVELSVRDTGVGIPEKDLPHIFDRFHRVEGTRRRTHEGTGIGLALVYELSKLHGGSVRAESAEGRGTTFVVSVPAGKKHLPAERATRVPPSTSTSLSPSLYAEEAIRWLPAPEEADPADEGLLGGTDAISAGAALDDRPSARVLLADDNADMRQYVSRLLDSHFDVHAVANGIEALEAARADPPDLVLSDVMMPGLDGFGLLQALRSDTKLGHIPVILLSARAGEEARVEGMRAGADDYLTKPFSGRELVARITAHVELSRLRRDAEARERGLRTEAEILNDIALTLGAELDHDTLVQKVTDAGKSLTGAAFGAFFYNKIDEKGESYALYTLSGAPREAFERFGMPRNTPLFGPTFRGEGPVRIDDVLEDPRYAKNPPHHGMPEGHLPVRSYLAVPVTSRSGAVLGGLFFGHPEPGVFTARAERLALGVAGQASIALDNAALYGQARREIEERRRAQERLHEEEKKFRLMADAAPVKIWMSTPDRQRTFFNQRWLNFAGRSMDQELGTGWTERLYADDFDRCMQTYATAFAAREPFTLEYRLRRHDGEFRWLLEHGMPLQGPAGEFSGFIGSSLDITERKLAEERIRASERALRESEARYRAIVEGQTEMVCRFRPDGTILFANGAYARARGTPPEVLVTQNFWEFVGEADRDSVREQLARLTVEQPELRIENRFDTAEGPRWTLWTNRGIAFDPDGRAAEVQSVGIDITDRKSVELALRESEQRFQNMANTAPAMFWVTETDASCSFLSRAWYEYTGQTEETALGFGWLTAVHPEDRVEAERIFRDAGRSHEPFSIDYRLRRADGEFRWAVDVGRPRFAPDGQFLGFIGSVMDVHERKEAEAALQAALASERQARSDAELASRLKDEFLATLSHELRTPLNAILGWSRIIGSKPGDLPTVTQGIEVIGRNAKVQTDLIADLLDMSRIISGKIRLEVEAVHLSDVVRAAVDAVRHAAEAKNVRIQTIVSPIADPVRGDASRLQQIVWNLLSNAVKFTPKGGRVQVIVAKKNSHAEIVVSDTGVGIRAEFLPVIFERFRQADSSTTRRFGGLGLGLSIVKHLVELHGGSVRVDSPGEGLGATFTVELPLALTHAPRPQQESFPPDDDDGDFELTGIRVLAVDDQQDARDLLRRILEERAAEVLTAASVDEGLRVLEEDRPDVVLCDIGMPGKDGYDFIKAVRRRGDATPAVAVTAFARSEDRLRALRAGFQGHVAKPVEPAELVATVAVFGRPAQRSSGRPD